MCIIQSPSNEAWNYAFNYNITVILSVKSKLVMNSHELKMRSCNIAGCAKYNLHPMKHGITVPSITKKNNNNNNQ